MKIELSLNELIILEASLKQTKKYSDETELYQKIFAHFECQKSIDRTESAIKQLKTTYPDE